MRSHLYQPHGGMIAGRRLAMGSCTVLPATAAAALHRQRAAPSPPCQATATAELHQAAIASKTDALFMPLKLGAIELSHRVVMAPLTRCRALGGVPQPNMVEYYGQRATEGGLLISEATCISNTAHGYPCTPTLYMPESLEGWRLITQAIHEKGGYFFMQLWHCGRASHPDYQPGGVDPIAPSAIPITGPFKVFSPKDYQMHEYPTPRAAEETDIQQVINHFGAAGRNALSVGADGVEIHGASGYIINRFLNARSNHRTDSYGGSIENRCRFALEIVETVCEAVGSADKVAIRFSPFGHYLMTPDPHTYAVFSYLLTELNKFGLAYVHLVDARDDDNPVIPLGNRADSLAPFRQVYGGNLIAASGYNGSSGAEAVTSGAADAIAFGRHFISNPDLPRRIALGAPLNKYDRSSFYAQTDEGYIDYKVLEETPEGKLFLEARE